MTAGLMVHQKVARKVVEMAGQLDDKLGVQMVSRLAELLAGKTAVQRVRPKVDLTDHCWVVKRALHWVDQLAEMKVWMKDLLLVALTVRQLVASVLSMVPHWVDYWVGWKVALMVAR